MLGRDGHAHRVAILSTRPVSDDGLHPPVEKADADLGKGARHLIGVRAQALVEKGQLRRTVVRRAGIPREQAGITALCREVRRKQIADAGQMHLFFLDDGFMPAQLEHVAGSDDRQTDDRQQDDHQLQAQG